ncbi:MAG: GNAT family N-acetyltransferase [Rhodobacteraceae bacterium]|nr:GNAT family N-acetyltransferase [Paracoccaceae bacterium]
MPSGKADTPITIRPARTGELAELSILCLRSKAVWGYDADFLAACRPRLILRPEDTATSHVAVATRRGHAMGVLQLTVQGESAMLNKLFVEPQALRTGIGRALFAEAVRIAREAGARTLVIDSDPAAAGFFRRMGASPAGEVACDCVPGHTLPRLLLAL